jgi:hypothetical protein
MIYFVFLIYYIMQFLWILGVLLLGIVGYILYQVYRPSSKYNPNSRIEVIIHFLGWTPSKIPHKYEYYKHYEPIQSDVTLKEGIRHRWVESRTSSLQMGQNELV